MSLKNIPLALATLSFTALIGTELPNAQEDGPPQSGLVAPSQSFEPFTGKIKRKNVRIRLRPDLDSPIVRELNRDEMVLVLGQQDSFYSVAPPKDVKGYIFRSFVLDNVVEGNRVNVRLQPSLDAPILGQLNAGDKVSGSVCSSAPKWMEIELPEMTRFYIAKELITSIGAPDLFAKLESQRSELDKRLSDACAFCQSELRKPYEEIDGDEVRQLFSTIADDSSEYPESARKAREMLSLFQEAYFQKRLAFLESRAEQNSQSFVAKQAAFDAEVATYQKKLHEIDRKLNGASSSNESFEEEIASLEDPSLYHFMTDKMRLWAPLEESLYLSWLQEHSGQSFDEFYSDEELRAVVITGIVEPFTKPVKNRPGDYILRIDNAPYAYLYSTKIDLQDKVGQQIKLLAVERPNNHFAFPAFFVLSVE